MDKVIPVIVVCSVGIALALAYIVFTVLQNILRNRGVKRKKHRSEFEIEDDALVIKLGKKRK